MHYVQHLPALIFAYTIREIVTSFYQFGKYYFTTCKEYLSLGSLKNVFDVTISADRACNRASLFMDFGPISPYNTIS